MPAVLAPPAGLRRSSRVCATASQPLSTVVSLGPETTPVYTLGGLSRKDRARVGEAVDLFHSNPQVLQECRRIRENADLYLSHARTSGLGSGYKASRDIPVGTRIVLYTGTIRPASTCLGDHEISLGEHFASCLLVIDGAPPLRAGGLPLGLMQLVNHACPPQQWSIPMALPRANCVVDDDPSLTCQLSGLPLLALRTARIIQAGEEILFPYQLRVTTTSFWRLESNLPPPTRGWRRVRCLCAAPAGCPNGLARNERCLKRPRIGPGHPVSPHLPPQALSPPLPPPLLPPLSPPPVRQPIPPPFRQQPITHYFSAPSRPSPPLAPQPPRPFPLPPPPTLRPLGSPPSPPLLDLTVCLPPPPAPPPLLPPPPLAQPCPLPSRLFLPPSLRQQGLTRYFPAPLHLDPPTTLPPSSSRGSPRSPPAPTLPPLASPPSPPLLDSVTCLPPPPVPLAPPPLRPPPLCGLDAPSPPPFSSIVILNVGPVGLVEALPQLVAHFKDLPAVVMCQECHLPHHSLAALKSAAHRLLPAYCVMAVRRGSILRANRTASIQVVTFVHVHLGARATLVDVKQQYDAVANTAPDVLLRTHFVRIVEPRTNASILLANVYQYQAAQPRQQAACLSLISAVFTRWGEQADCIIAGGDWNASVCPRVGYVDSERVRNADTSLLDWSAASGLECCAPEAPTWSSFNDARRAVLDCFFCKSRTSLACLKDATAFLSADPRHDHCGVRATLSVIGIGPMPPLEALCRPVRLKMTNWTSRRDEWRERVTQALQSIVPVAGDDPFARLDCMRRVAVNCARSILGTTGGRMRASVPRHSSEFITLRSRLALLRVVRREIYQRQLAGSRPSQPSRAMKRAWDGGWYPAPATFAALSDLWAPAHAAWTDSWCRYLRQKIHTLTEQLQELRKDELTREMARARNEAISRFWTNGELRRLIHPRPPGLHTPQIRTAYPDAVVISGCSSKLCHLDEELRTLPFSVTVAAESITVSGLGPSTLYRILDLVSDQGLQVRLTGQTRTVFSVEDRLGAFEAVLASEASATKATCPQCRGSGCFLAVPRPQAGARAVRIWCRACASYRQPVVDPRMWADIPLCLRNIPRVAPGAGETLKGIITQDDFDYFVGQLPNNKASPDCLLNELVRHGPDLFKETIRCCLNRILDEGAPLPSSWKGGLIRFIFKKGDVQDIACYRPICLLDTIYKILSAVLTDRLYRLCERHSLLDPSQEGFRRLHSTQRQVQSLHWAWEQAADRKVPLFVIYIDFEWAFNSIDLEALWRWLEELNVPDVDLLRRLYDGAFYEADLPYGRSAPIFLLRGNKQGDKPSPLLFGLIFNALLLALRATGVGHNSISGLRAPSRGFADDLALTTETASGTSRLLAVVSAFCSWTGARVNLAKSVITAYDFGGKVELPTDDILYNGSPLVHLPTDQSFPYLGVRASLVSAGKRRSAGPILAAEKEHVLAATRELVSIAREHSRTYLLSQMVPAMHMVATARFRYSAPLVPWTDAELEDVHKVWLQVDRASWRLSKGFPSAPLALPTENGGGAVPHPRVLLIQALAMHIEQLVALPDQLREDTIARFRRLCDSCGCHTARELALSLAEERSPRKCPIARFLRACGQLGVQSRLPACLSLGKTERETSWHCLLTHLLRLASLDDESNDLKQAVACVASSWGAIRRRLRGRGVRIPRQLVVAAIRDRPAA